MIRISDAIILAYTKLKTRRVRTFFTVIISSLLFGAITVGILFIQGSVDSINKFSTNSLSGRFLATATYSSNLYPGSEELPDSIKARAYELYNKLIADKKKAAKDLGVDYDPIYEQKPTMKFGDQEYLDSSSISTIQAFNEYIATLPSSRQKLNELNEKYNAIKSYDVSYTSGYYDSMKMITEDKGEIFDKSPDYSQNGSSVDLNFGWVYMDQSITTPFMLPENQIVKQSDKSMVPIIAPIEKVESALGLKKIANNATSVEKLNRLTYIRDNAEKATFSVCYRNSVSKAQIQSAIDTEKLINENKNNKDFQKPSLIYGLPDDSKTCAPAKIISDTRTKAEKAIADKQNQFAAMFGQEIEPVQQKISFRTVGLSPNGFSADSFSGVSSLIMTIAGSTLEGKWVIPKQTFDSMPNKNDYSIIFPITENSVKSKEINYDSVSMTVEFSSAADVKKFVDENGCGSMYCDNQKSIIYFGVNSVLIEDIKKQVINILGYITLVISVIAGVIMMGMTGRVIGDSRRETAVFRAIGAKRSDIGLIYLSYTFMLSVIIAGLSLIIGLIASILIDSYASPEATVQAHLSYIFTDDTIRFSFIGLWIEAILILVCVVILTGLIGTILPLLRNLARSPIKDMRDDT